MNMDDKKFLGTWKICKAQASNGLDVILENVKFSLNESGDVIFFINDCMLGAWDNPKQSTEPSLPLLECDSYKISTFDAKHRIEFFKDETFVTDFTIDKSVFGDFFTVKYQSPTCTLYCNKLPDTPIYFQNPEQPFSFLTAFHEEFFSDLTITADDNTKFNVHSVILKLSGLCGNTNRFRSLEGLPSSVLKTILHWAYGNCLQSDITAEVCHEIIKMAESAAVLTSLAASCKIFIANLEIKHRIESIVMDMYICLKQCIENLTSKDADSPVQLCHAFKNGMKEIAIAGAHFLELCLDLKVNCNNLHPADKHAILRYAFSLFPVFVKLLYKGLKGAWDSFKELSPSHKQELAQYVIPEVEGFLNSFTTVFAHAKLVVEKLIEIVEAETASEAPSTSKVISRNKCDYGYNELTILKILHSKITYLMLYGIDKRECFDEMSQNEKYRAVTHNFDMISEEFPLFIVRLQEVISTLDDKYDPYEFNFGFKLTTTTVAGILERIISHADIAEKLIEQMCAIMQRERFTQIMKTLGILKPKSKNSDSDSTSGMIYDNTSRVWKRNVNKNQTELNCQLVIGEYLHSPPSSDYSMLARKVTRLLYNERHTDMEFIVVSTREDKSPLSETPSSMESNTLSSPDPIVIRAHRVIVAARCPWFRRALLSGMLEDRNRKIIIYDTSPNVFKEFLHYLYGKSVSTACMSNQDALSELMLLADRYEVDELKKIAEFLLISGVDDDSAIYLLSISDQINAEALRATCLEYIAVNPVLMNNDLFKKLPEDLQSETAEFVKWKTPSRRANRYRERLLCEAPTPPRCVRSDSMTLPERDTFRDLEEMMLHGDLSSLLSLDSLSNDSDEHLQACLTLIRDIVGNGPSNETLIRVILAADYDINRAVNFFYSE